MRYVTCYITILLWHRYHLLPDVSYPAMSLDLVHLTSLDNSVPLWNPDPVVWPECTPLRRQKSTCLPACKQSGQDASPLAYLPSLSIPQRSLICRPPSGSGPSPITDELLRYITFWQSDSILTLAAFPASTALAAQETHSLLHVLQIPGVLSFVIWVRRIHRYPLLKNNKPTDYFVIIISKCCSSTSSTSSTSSGGSKLLGLIL